MLPIFDTDDMVKMCYKFNLNFKKNKSAAASFPLTGRGQSDGKKNII